MGIVIGVILAFFYFNYFAPRYEIKKVGLSLVKLDKWTGQSWRYMNNNWKKVMYTNQEWKEIDQTLAEALNIPIADTKTESPVLSETGKMQAASIDPVNINKADVKTLTTLKGIGKDRAQKIVEYREKNGPFQKPEDLMKVKGIGKKIFDQNKDFILI